MSREGGRSVGLCPSAGLGKLGQRETSLGDQIVTVQAAPYASEVTHSMGWWGFYRINTNSAYVPQGVEGGPWRG